MTFDLLEGAEYDQGRIFSAVFEGVERAFCLGARPGDLKDPVTSGVSAFEVYTLGIQVDEEASVDAPPVIAVQGGKMWAACIPPDRIMKKGNRSGPRCRSLIFDFRSHDHFAIINIWPHFNQTWFVAIRMYIFMAVSWALIPQMPSEGRSTLCALPCRMSEKLWPWDGVLAFNYKDETMIALEEEDRKRGQGDAEKDEAVGEAGAGDGDAGKEGVFRGGRSIECKKVVDYSLPIVRIVRVEEWSGENGDGLQDGLSKLQGESGVEASNNQHADMLIVNYSQLRGEWICKAGYVPVASSGGGGDEPKT